jgi:thioredoxin-dependent peroxiredoxin
MKHSLLLFSAVVILAIAFPFHLHAASPPNIGDKAQDFTLQTLDGKTVQLSALIGQKPVVLVVLRGWPGYQCPLCSAQVHDFVRHSEAFRAANSQVVMVYPGPATDLKAHASEFLSDKSWPDNFIFVLDPDYTFTNAYGLRWNAPKETAYPSTFILDDTGMVRFEHVSKVHGDRIGAETALNTLDKI